MLPQSLSRSDCSQTNIAVYLRADGNAGRSGCIYARTYERRHTHQSTTYKNHTKSLPSDSLEMAHALIQAHVTLIFLNFLSSTRIESMEAHPVSAVGRGSVLLPVWTGFQSGIVDWWWHLPAQWWMAVWMGGMEESS